MKKIWVLIVFILLFISSFTLVHAESSYVLPYPSEMPGNSFYKVHKIIELVEQYWYFGSLSQFKYNLKYSDKYLVEAKTLFEYKQYFLAVNALHTSDLYFENIPITIQDGKKENKDISENEKLLQEAARKHVEVLRDLKQKIPSEFIWQPEKSASTLLPLDKLVNHSITIRGQVL